MLLHAAVLCWTVCLRPWLPGPTELVYNARPSAPLLGYLAREIMDYPGNGISCYYPF